MPFEKFPDQDVRVEANRLPVRADEGPAKDPRRPVRDVVALQRFEERLLDLGPFRDRAERDVLLFALLAQAGAKTLRRIHGHRRTHQAQPGPRAAIVLPTGPPLANRFRCCGSNTALHNEVKRALSCDPGRSP